MFCAEDGARGRFILLLMQVELLTGTTRVRRLVLKKWISYVGMWMPVLRLIFCEGRVKARHSALLRRDKKWAHKIASTKQIAHVMCTT